MAKRNVYSVICLDEYYNLGSFRTVFRFNHYINLVLKLNLSEQIQIGFQFTDRLGNTLKAVCNGDSNV